MTLILWITMTVLTIHATDSYILLTANLEDVHAIAKQLADSPVADQIKSIWRRASNQFNIQVAKSTQQEYNKRSNKNVESNSIDENQSRAVGGQSEESGERVERRHGDAPANNTSFYLGDKQGTADEQE